MKSSRIRDDHFVDFWLPAAKPEISILMPIYNQREFVGAALSSILSQEGIAAEIMVSDDGSDDGTFDEALRVISGRIEKADCAHTIVVRRGKNRLWRDHLPLLVDNSRCDLVCQAHGDDLSAASRCRNLVSVFKADLGVSLVTSEAAIFVNPRDRDRLSTANGQSIKLYEFSQSEILDGHELLSGSLPAWRKSAVEGFPRLDKSFSAASHDRILAFRASLTGKVMLLKAPLVNRRIHPSQSSNLIFHEPDRNCSFGLSLLRMNALSAMKRDLLKAGEKGFVGREKMDMLEKDINGRLEAFQKSLIESFRIYTNSGKHISWVDDRTIHKLNNNFIKKIKFRALSIVLLVLKQGKGALRFIRSFSAKSITGSKKGK
jgi:hypothetical protein